MRRTDETRDEARLGPLEKVERRALLFDAAVLQDHDAIGKRHRLDLVMGDIHESLAEFLMQALELGAHLVPQLRVEVGKRFVEKEEASVADDGAADCNPLPLAAG